MVLIFILASFFLSDTSLLSKYEDIASKEISKHLELGAYDLESEDTTVGEFYTIKNSTETIAYLLVSEVAACSLGGCPTYKAVETDASSEYFDMMAIIDTDGNIISIKILDYFSDYGYEITSKKYLKKFKDYSICSIYRGDDTIDAISGATISSYALEAKLGQLCRLIE